MTSEDDWKASQYQYVLPDGLEAVDEIVALSDYDYEDELRDAMETAGVESASSTSEDDGETPDIADTDDSDDSDVNEFSCPNCDGHVTGKPDECPHCSAGYSW